MNWRHAFSLDRLQEMGASLWRHPVRTVLTTLSVAWGTFVLVVLLGMGQGLQNNVKWQFRDDATNSVWFFRGETRRAFAGRAPGREIRFENQDFDAIRRRGLEGPASGRFYPFRGGTIGYGARTGSFDVRAVHPDHQYHERTEIVAGRFLHEIDLESQRKVAVIGNEVSDFLFEGEDPLGEWITIAGVPFLVVGVFVDAGGGGEPRKIYVPVTTAQGVYAGGRRELNLMMFSVGDASAAEAEAFADSVRSQLAARHQFHPEDRQAVRVRNNVERFERTQRIYRLLDLFVWMIGLGTIAAGIVGVSNIMLVTVRERIPEIGLRKALGATPASIMAGILQEAVFLTAVAGYLGVVGGVVVLEAIRGWMPENDYLREPEITLMPALVAAGLLVIFGALAGAVPAWRAARIQPVEALRS